MIIKSIRKIFCYLFKYKQIRKCPEQITQCEGLQCQEVRRLIASTNYDPITNLSYIYTQENLTYETASNFCQGLFFYKLATLSELNQLAHMFTYVDKDGNPQNCPTLVWSRKANGKPVIVRIAPCNGDRIELIRRFDLVTCKVQGICVSLKGN